MNNHEYPISNSDWRVKADGPDCVSVYILNRIDLSRCEFSLLNENRQLIVRMKVTSNDIHICCHTERPIFAQLNNDVKYVDGSGEEAYKNSSK